MSEEMIYTKNLATISDRVMNFDDNEKFIRAWKMVQNLKIAVRNIESDLKERGLKFMESQNLTSLDIDSRYKIIVGTKKTDRYETEAIYKALEFTPEQQSILPKNPKFRKTQILANKKTSPAHWIDEKDEIEIKELDADFLPKGKK